MNTSRQSFSQVKDILKKLDQSIDAARAKRVSGDAPRRTDAPGGVQPAAQPARPNGFQNGAGPGNNGSYGRPLG